MTKDQKFPSMKSKLMIAAFLTTGTFSAKSQSIMPEVLASSGDHFGNAAGQISYTLGELMTETRTTSNNILTEGFHQPDLLITTVNHFEPTVSAEIFPNPATHEFTILLNGRDPLYSFRITDAQGKLIHEGKIMNTIRETVDVSELPSGIYLVQISDIHGTLLRTSKLVRAY